MQSALEGPYLKITRANEHIAELAARINNFFTYQSPALVVEKDIETGDRLVKVKLVEPIPKMLPLVIGDAIYNLRSSLEHLAVILAKLQSTTVKRVYFPVYQKAERFYAETEGKLQIEFGEEAVKVFKDIKPFKGGNDLLWCLNRIRIDDYHNFIIPVGTFGGIDLLRNASVAHAKVGLIVSGPGRLDEGIVISNLGANGTFELAEGPQPNLQVSGDLVFGDVEIVGGQLALGTLYQMSELAQNIIGMFHDRLFS